VIAFVGEEAGGVQVIFALAAFLVITTLVGGEGSAEVLKVFPVVEALGLAMSLVV